MIIGKSIDAFFKWKVADKNSIEKINRDNKYVRKWNKIDVLYSFIGIYTIGIYTFYKEECRRTNYLIKTLDGGFFSKDYLANHYMDFPKLNKVIEDVGFIEVYDSVGNLIPVWPGANVDRGTRAYCFDIPEVYFGNMYYEWFKLLCNMYPDAHLEIIIDKAFVYDTKTFLDEMDEKKYVEYLEHIVNVIRKRTVSLNS